MPVTFSIVTPTFNSARFLRETMLSVLSQKGNFSIEYIIVDNNSTDETGDIVVELQKTIIEDESIVQCRSVDIKFICEDDSNMYEAINKGFDASEGNVCAWINSDDIYLANAFQKMSQVFSLYDDIFWVKGITSYIDESSVKSRVGKCLLYPQEWIKHGVYGRDYYFIQQDSVFWRAELLNRVNGVSSNLQLAGDYNLWVRFAECERLATLNEEVSCFRKVEGQLSQNFQAYENEMKQFKSGDDAFSKKCRLYIRYINKLPKLFKKIVYSFMFPREMISLLYLDANNNMQRYDSSFFSVQSKLGKSQ